MRIPITMCHGIQWQPNLRKHRKDLLTKARFERYFAIASEMGFTSISYNDLHDWREGKATLPPRPVMFDFDHPDWAIAKIIWPIMQRYGFQGNLFVNTSPMEKIGNMSYMKWDDLRALIEGGWHIGAHTYRHYGMDYLTKRDPSGSLIQEELRKSDKMLEDNLGIVPRDFAFTSTTWSQIAEDEVKKRYRFGRLWIVGTHYSTAQGPIRYADLVGVDGPDEEDGGPPNKARYITRDTHPYRLPSMELDSLIYEYGAFQRYLVGAIGD